MRDGAYEAVSVNLSLADTFNSQNPFYPMDIAQTWIAGHP